MIAFDLWSFDVNVDPLFPGIGLLEYLSGAIHDPIMNGFQWVDLRENLEDTIDFSHEIWDFPVMFPLNQSIEVYNRNTQTNMDILGRTPKI